MILQNYTIEHNFATIYKRNFDIFLKFTKYWSKFVIFTGFLVFFVNKNKSPRRKTGRGSLSWGLNG